ncbi:N-acetylneuraminate synthase family protein [Anaerosporobacter faecicola]|uniref:N-acetylneuraminate synthase family protein n=1 Tax=Anaerosporobacter faecicola TaxID=2718714 RepID=UPI001439C511|nr:N-acetylneuraminate synthase family protein [Anaerosporobacter faecicola]
MIKLDNNTIGGERTYIIAEIGSNHNQDINLAYEMMEIAKECGADAVKFQSIKGEKLYQYSRISPEQIDLLKKIQLEEDWYDKIFDYAKKIGITCLSAPTYLDAIDLLNAQQVPIVKIASPQTYGFPQLIEKVNDMNVPIIMSTGYCLYKDIERAVKLIRNREQLILLHCIASYPTPVDEVNLNFIDTLKAMFGTVVGFSDHTLGYHITLAAVARGAKVIEKHITLSRKNIGPDHFFAIEPNEFKSMVSCIRDIEKALGNGIRNNLTEFELENRDTFEMRLYSRNKVEKGKIITKEDIDYYRGDNSMISAWNLNEIVGKQVQAEIESNHPLKIKDFL